jgi:hypothetical protein
MTTIKGRVTPFPQTSLYVSLSNLSVGFESFLKIVGETKLTAQSKKLYDYIRDLFHNERTWWNQFQSKCGGDSTIERIYDTVTDPILYPTAKIFLTTYLIRNLVMHTYTTTYEFYEDVFSEVYLSLLYSMFYTWSSALKQSWI